METSKYLSADERRAVTVEAVVALAGEQNPSDITTAAIASHMGVTQGALFRHFPNKDAILQAVMEWVAERLLARIENARKKATDPIAALEAIFFAHVEFITKHPGIPRIVFAELQRPETSGAKRMVQTLVQRYRKHLQETLQQGQRDGTFPTQLDVEAAAVLFLGMIQGLVMQSLLAGDVKQMRRDANRIFAIYLRGIRSQP